MIGVVVTFPVDEERQDGINKDFQNIDTMVGELREVLALNPQWESVIIIKGVSAQRIVDSGPPPPIPN